MPEQLQRQVGPFKIWQWLLIVIVGVGLGLLIRSRMGASPGPTKLSQTSDPNSFPATQGAPTILQQDFDSIRTIRDEQDRFQDEADRRDEELLTRQENFFTDIRKRITAINIPVEDKTESKTVTPLPEIVNDVPTKQYLPLTASRIRALFADFPGAFKGDPEYWVRGFTNTGTPGVDAAQESEWSNFWAAFERAGLKR